MRTFTSGATRDDSADKPDYEGYLSPVVLQRFGAYMQQHSIQADGVQRASDNWQRGIPKEEYLKSAWRHFLAWWLAHRGGTSRESVEDALCALLFNVQGYLHALLTEMPPATLAGALQHIYSVAVNPNPVLGQPSIWIVEPLPGPTVEDAAPTQAVEP